jgi:small subunit ribosomal protein S16
MLAIRLQRLGRKAAPVYRLAVQEAQRHPSSGRVVAYVGAYNPHTKEVKINAEKVGFYLKNGAQPTPRVVKLLIDQKVDLPAWVKQPRTDRAATIRKPEKLRKNQPKEEAPAEAPAEETPAETPVEEVTAEESPSEPVKEETKE